jgi:ribonuclease R
MARKKKSEVKKQKEQIIAFLKSHTDRPYTLSDLNNQFNVYSDEDKLFFKLILEDLVDENKINQVGRGKYEIGNGQKSELIEGVVDHVNPKFAFIRYNENESDVFVDADKLNGAWDGDTVSVKIFPGKVRNGKNPEGKVEEILKRGKREIVGKIKVFANYALLKPDTKNIHEEIFIAKSNIGNAITYDLAIVKIIEYPTPYQQGTGKVIEVLGQAGDNDAEMNAIMAEFGLPVKFPDEVHQLAESIPVEIEPSEIAKRRDMRDTLTFTIDPADAKDFDDAISFKTLDNGNFEVGIHIADVTHYVREGTVLETEAFRRATSVYLVDRTIPMLPEKLSNNLCSLRPNEDKLVFSAIFELDINGQLKNEWFGRCIIHSDRRFAYEQAQEVLEQNDSSREPIYFDVLNTLNTIAKTMRKERFKNGAFNFESNEVKFQLDENGKPLGVYQKVRKDAHKLIEEFMLLANKKVAEFIFFGKYDEKVKQRVAKNPDNPPTMVYRIHEPPNPEKVETFAKFAAKMGYSVNTASQNTLSNSLNKLVSDVEGKPIQSVIESLAIRTMSKARYATSPQGHFGLAFAHYSHFTSPIRRYPDMMAHRLLQHYLDKGAYASAEAYNAKCEHSSAQEKLAAEAERASIKYKQVEYMSYQDHNQVFNGVITGVTDFGLFVEIEGTGCEGMVRLADLNDDYYEYDKENYRVFGQRNGVIISFGDAVKVRIKTTDLEKRSMDLEMVEMAGKAMKKSNGGRKYGSSGGRQSGGRSSAKKPRGRNVIPPKKEIEGRKSK